MNKSHQPGIKAIPNNPQYLPAGLYTWFVTVLFGAILLDVVYASAAPEAVMASGTTAMFSEGADLLLLLAGLTILAGIATVVSSWNYGTGRILFSLSLLFVLLEFAMPFLFITLFPNGLAEAGINPGPLIRLTGSALASILAFSGLGKLYKSRF